MAVDAPTPIVTKASEAMTLVCDGQKNRPGSSTRKDFDYLRHLSRELCSFYMDK